MYSVKTAFIAIMLFASLTNKTMSICSLSWAIIRLKLITSVYTRYRDTSSNQSAKFQGRATETFKQIGRAYKVLLKAY